MCHEQDGDFNMFYEVKCSCDDVIRLRKQGAWGGSRGSEGGVEGTRGGGGKWGLNKMKFDLMKTHKITQFLEKARHSCRLS